MFNGKIFRDQMLRQILKWSWNTCFWEQINDIFTSLKKTLLNDFCSCSESYFINTVNPSFSSVCLLAMLQSEENLKKFCFLIFCIIPLASHWTQSWADTQQTSVVFLLIPNHQMQHWCGRHTFFYGHYVKLNTGPFSYMLNDLIHQTIFWSSVSTSLITYRSSSNFISVIVVPTF